MQNKHFQSPKFDLVILQEISMAPKKRGGSTRVQPSKNEKTPKSKDGHEEIEVVQKPTLNHVEEKNLLVIKPRKSPRTVSIPNA